VKWLFESHRRYMQLTGHILNVRVHGKESFICSGEEMWSCVVQL